jgi:hypothetical protein
MSRVSVAIVVATLFSASTSVAIDSTTKDAPLTTCIPKVAKAPSLDGRIDADEWQAAAAVSGFMFGEKWAAAQTSVFLMTDMKNLFFAFKCNAIGPLNIAKKGYDNDALAIFGDESVQMFLQPDPASPVYYHLAFNSRGGQYSAKCKAKTIKENRDASWNPELKIATSSGKDFWTVEGVLPLESLQAVVTPGAAWGVNFGRTCVEPTDREISSWTGQQDFNNPDLFGKAILAGSSTTDYLMGNLVNPDMGVNLTLRNHLGKKLSCRVSLSDGVATSSQECVLGPLGVQEVTLKPASMDTKATLAITGKGIAFRKSGWMFRDRIRFTALPELYYCPVGTESMGVKLVNCPEQVEKLSWTLRGGGTEQALSSGSLPQDARDFRLDLKGLPVGRYALSVKASSAAGEKVTVHDSIFLIHHPFAKSTLPERQEFRLSGATILMNGVPFFPFMRSWSPKNVPPPLVEDAFNVKFATDGVMSNAASRGSCGLLSVLSRVNGTHYELPSTEENLDAVTKCIADKSAGLCVFRNLKYEASIPPFRKQNDGSLVPLNPVEEYQRVYMHIKAIAPETLVSIHTDDFDSFEEFLPCADVIEIASRRSSYARDIALQLPQDLREARRKADGKPLVWWIGASIPSPQFRTAENLRMAGYLTMLLGGNGVSFHMGHGGVPSSMTRLWSVFPGLARELEFLYPIVVNGKAVEMPPLDAASSGIEVLARESEGSLYIMAVNTWPRSVKARFALPSGVSAKGVKQAEVLFEGRSVNIKNGKLSDEFTPGEPHVYKIR